MAVTSKKPARKRFKSLFRIYLGNEIALGPGKAELLGHIANTGSIAEAARRMEMSYNRAWLLVRTMNHCFKKPLVLVTRGGERRGGAQLSKFGEDVLDYYKHLESQFQAAARRPLQQILSRLKD